jgi:hypothetical protein
MFNIKAIKPKTEGENHGSKETGKKSGEKGCEGG